MSGFQPKFLKVARHTERQKTQYEETKQASKPDSDMAGKLELSDWKFKTTMIDMLNGKVL